VDWLFNHPWFDPILALVAIFAALAAFSHFIHRRNR
jgi:hypothetical protein